MYRISSPDLFSLEAQQSKQPGQVLKPIVSNIIDGLVYYNDFISREEENNLIKIINQEPWLGDLKRRVQHYGWKYDYRARSLTSELFLGPLPTWAQNLALRLQYHGLIEDLPDQVIINEYKPGQGIANHVDCEPCFGDTIISISLGSISVMSFINLQSNMRVEAVLDRRSAICIKGECRYNWSHGISARLADDIYGVRINRGLRISITFRKVII